MWIHFKFKPWRCKLCSSEYIQSSALEKHIATTHLKLVSNLKQFYAKLSVVKPQVQQYKEKIPFKLVDWNTAVYGEPNEEGVQKSLHKVKEEDEDDTEVQKAVKKSASDFH